MELQIKTALAQIPETLNTVPVAVAVTKSSSVSRTTSSTPFNKLRIAIQFPALQKFEDDGNISGTEVEINIKLTGATGTVFTPITGDKINGKATSPYIKEYEIDFSSSFADSNFPLTITVERVTDDSTDTKLQNATNFLSFY